MHRTLTLFTTMIIGSSAWAQDPPTPEGATAPAEATASEKDSEDASEEEATAPDQVTAAEASPPIRVILTLTSGVQMTGTVSQSDLLTWAPGSAMDFTPDGGTTVSLTGDRISTVTTAAAPAAPTAPSVQAPVVTAPATASDYKSAGGYSFPNPAASRYLYAPSSIPLKQGQGYVSQKLVFTSAAYAVHDNLTLLYGAFTFFPPALSVFGTKAGFQIKENLHVSVGGEVFIAGLSQDIPAAIGFGAVTFGDEDKNLTVASGYADGSILNQATIPIMVGGQLRTADSFAVITENWVFLDPSDFTAGYGIQSVDVFLGSVALRIIGRRDRLSGGQRGMVTRSGHPRTTWDIGLLAFGFRDRASMTVQATGETVESSYYSWTAFGPIPWIDWTWHFGKEGG